MQLVRQNTVNPAFQLLRIICIPKHLIIKNISRNIFHFADDQRKIIIIGLLQNPYIGADNFLFSVLVGKSIDHERSDHLQCTDDHYQT